MKYIVFILVVAAVVAQMAHAQGMFNANLNGSVSGSIEVAGHRMNFTGEIRPKRHALASNDTAPAGHHKHGGQGDEGPKGKEQ